MNCENYKVNKKQIVKVNVNYDGRHLLFSFFVRVFFNSITK